jgi:hypothetical protein
MRPFTDTLNSLRFGQVTHDLTDAMAALVQACTETGKAGSITLVLKMVPGKSGQVEIEDKITSKPPKFDQSTTIMFVTPEGNLQRTDPRQADLPGLRVAETVNPETGEIETSRSAA